MTSFYMIGAGGLAKDALHILEEINSLPENEDYSKYDLLGFIDPYKNGEIYLGYPVFGSEYVSENVIHQEAIITIGDCRIKRKVANELDNEVKWINLIHPIGTHPNSGEHGVGNLVYAYTSSSIDAKIGNHNFLDVGVSVGHDSVVGDYCTLCNYAVVVEGSILKDGVQMGAHSVVYGGVTIGEGSIISAGAAVGFDVPPNSLVMNSAQPRIIKKLCELK